jgi:hypothetical protein
VRGFLIAMKECEICRNPAPDHPLARLCRRCKKIVDRTDIRAKHNAGARIRALTLAWEGDGFRCYYTGVRVVEDDKLDPRYLTLDHRTPNREDDIVVAGALVNDMKSNMTEEQFKDMVAQLSRRFSGEQFDENIFKRLPRRIR